MLCEARSRPGCDLLQLKFGGIPEGFGNAVGPLFIGDGPSTPVRAPPPRRRSLSVPSSLGMVLQPLSNTNVCRRMQAPRLGFFATVQSAQKAERFAQLLPHSVPS